MRSYIHKRVRLYLLYVKGKSLFKVEVTEQNLVSVQN